VRGIKTYAGYVPFRRLDRAAIAQVFGGAPRRGQRSVASFDEDTTTMAFEAARLTLRGIDATTPDALWFATAEPAYLEKTNATAIHAALRLDSDVPAIDMGGAVRSGVGAFRAALDGNGTVLVATAGLRGGQPTGADEAEGGDGAAAVLVGDDASGSPVIAEYLGGASVTEEFLDRWRAPGAITNRKWEERFGETRYVPLGEQAWNAALKQANLSADEVNVAVVTGSHGRATKAFARTLSCTVADDLSSTVGNTGASQFALLLASVLDQAEPGQVIALVVLADGADVALFRATDAISSFTPARPIARQIEAGAPIEYGKFLSWRGIVELEPPNRPTPNRPSASAAARSSDWKFGFVGSRDRSTGIVHMPPQRAGINDGGLDDMEPVPEAENPATIMTYTVDRLIYSESPPVIFAVLNFEGGGRFPCELTDVDESDVAVGGRVEMTFRRLFTADGIHNYFWKARPIR
jgi:hydroxymethylglutaryl-CoA synthase